MGSKNRHQGGPKGWAITVDLKGGQSGWAQDGYNGGCQGVYVSG